MNMQYWVTIMYSLSLIKDEFKYLIVMANGKNGNWIAFRGGMAERKDP